MCIVAQVCSEKPVFCKIVGTVGLGQRFFCVRLANYFFKYPKILGRGKKCRF